MRLIYGFDALCGWCYGFVPAMRAVRAAYPDLPITLAMPGLAVGPRVGPYAEMEGYIRGAAKRLEAVTGRASSDAFYSMIRRPGVVGNSGPPGVAIAAVADAFPGAEIAFAHAVIEAHFGAGADLNDPETYRAIAAEQGIEVAFPDLTDPALTRQVQAAGAQFSVQSFPTLMFERNGALHAFPTAYDPDEVVAMVRAAVTSEASEGA